MRASFKALSFFFVQNLNTGNGAAADERRYCIHAVLPFIQSREVYETMYCILADKACCRGICAVQGIGIEF